MATITLHGLGNDFSWCLVFSALHCVSTMVHFQHQRVKDPFIAKHIPKYVCQYIKIHLKCDKQNVK